MANSAGDSDILVLHMLQQLVQVRVSTEFKERLEEEARREGRPATEIVRQLIIDWLKAHYPDLGPREEGTVAVQEVRQAQDASPTAPVYPVLCWACRQGINWRVDLGPQGYCPHCGAFIDVRTAR